VARPSIIKDNWKIDPAKTACLVIDMQRAFLDKGAPRECPSGRELVPKINQLFATCRRLRMPVIHTRVSHRRDLSDVGIRQEIRPLDVNDELETIEGNSGWSQKTMWFLRDASVLLYPDHLISKRSYAG
jgi:nicotinamidase-related amidase